MIFKLFKALFPPRYYLVKDGHLPVVHFENDPEHTRQGLDKARAYETLSQMWRLRSEQPISLDHPAHTIRLAPGWFIMPHARQQDTRIIRDHRNRIRGQLLFNGRALYVYCRYQFELGYETPDGKYRDGCKVRCQVLDAGSGWVVYRTAAFDSDVNDNGKYESQVYEWLDRRFPDYRNAFAYWD